MKPESDEDLPELLRKRILRQRKRMKIVRFTFALTVISSVVLLFLANQSQNFAPNARVTSIIPSGEQTWLLDQQLDLTAENVEPSGSFALIKVDGEEVTPGVRYEGLARGATRMGPDRIGITTRSRFMEFDTSGDEWQRAELRTLGLNDTSASPLVIWFKDALWLCWLYGSDVMVRPLDRPEVKARSLLKTDTAGAVLQGRVTDKAIWLSIREAHDGDLTLVSFTPGIEEIKPATPEDTESDADNVPDPKPKDETEPADAPEPQYGTTVQRHFSSDVTSNLRSSSFAVVSSEQGPRPVVAITRKDEKNRTWQMLVWTSDETSKGKWVDADAPDRSKPASGLEITNFMSLEANGKVLHAIFSEAGKVRSTQTNLAKDGSLDWSEAIELPLDKTTGPTAYIVWVTVLFGMLLVMASQGVWLLLNRERTMDRTLADIIDNQKKGTTDKAKDEPKLLYANALGRALALLLDLAITSPIIILLRSVYSYTWDQAYQFLAIGSVSEFDKSLMPGIFATLVTLLVLTIYSMVCELVWGRTFGKAVLRLRVVDADGEQPSGWRIVVRNVFKIVELIHWVVLMVPMGLMMMSGKQQRLGDLAAGTFVIVDVVADEAADDMEL